VRTLYQYACSVSSSMYDTHSFAWPGWSPNPPLVMARCALPPSSLLPAVIAGTGLVQDASPCEYDDLRKQNMC
jgi:hypothetical protein